MRVIEVNMEWRRNEGAGETGDPLENPPTNGIVRQDSHLRNNSLRETANSHTCVHSKLHTTKANATGEWRLHIQHKLEGLGSRQWLLTSIGYSRRLVRRRSGVLEALGSNPGCAHNRPSPVRQSTVRQLKATHNSPSSVDPSGRKMFSVTTLQHELSRPETNVFVERRPDTHVSEGSVVSRYWVVTSAEKMGTVPLTVRELPQRAVAIQVQAQFPHPRRRVQTFGQLLRPDSTMHVVESGHPMRVKRGEYAVAPECKGGGNGRYPRKPADQRHRPARFPRVKIRERPLPGIEPGSPR
ncbi:hypothetical protein PR048_029683 [Dryococelus australis]|uniref:Uncharacterized protein n=1 Tax=Dryococelus australis TaxID=614101 RepID=A0ABQ9GE37_9NEOP|nr:hypothetical protein PR048_029683 [Dryococelus australis]